MLRIFGGLAPLLVVGGCLMVNPNHDEDGTGAATLAMSETTGPSGTSEGTTSPPSTVSSITDSSGSSGSGDSADDGSTGDGDGTTGGGVVDETTGGQGGSTGGDDGGSTSGDTGTACQNALTCPTATVLGMVSGDETSPLLTASGDEPTWVAFRVTEDNEDATGEKLSFTVTLESPEAVDFDLYVYRGGEEASNGCDGTMSQSTAAGTLDVVSMNWGEGTFANGEDDARWIAVEVVPKDGCEPGSNWALTIEGDT